MATRTRGTRRGGPGGALDGALLRLAVDGEDWAEHIPPVPPGQDVTVSFSSPEVEAAHGDALALLGYRLVPPQPTGTGEEHADVLVTQAVLEAHPTWWRALAGMADRAYNLAMGPVVASLGPRLVAHLGLAVTAPAPRR